MYVINQQTLLAVTMCKTVVLLLAVLANICLLVSSTESKSYSRTASSSSSSSSQSNSSSSYSSSECTEDDEDYEPTCCEDEVYSDCINGGCQAKNCSQIGKPIPCVKIDPKYCIEGCLCKDGYLRTVGGTCVPKDKCDEGCGGDPNAVSGCGVNCGRLCSNYKKKGVACPAICKLDGCDCKPDYVFDSITQKCVFPKDCTPTCGTNEVYSNCSNQICSFQNCSEVGGIIRFCPKIDETRCKGGCICQEGYLRNTKGVCVLRKECDICNHDINSVPGCGINCGRLCSNYDKGPVPCPKICKTNACNCKPDFVMDTNTGKCVLPKDCTPTCGTDEIYSSCVNGLCRAVNCSQKGKPIACPLLIKGACRGGCICKDKYLREKNGTCVPQDQCGVVPPQCGKNEVFNECPIICPPKRCDVDITVILCQVPPKPGDPDCKPSCECIDGYLRDKNGLCIPKDKCPQTCDGPNEEWDSCPPNCPPQTCASIGKIYHCPLQTIPPTNCKGSCRCKEGFYRNDFGECISYEACTQNCTGKNEEWDTCPPICPPQTCESIGKSYSCPAMINGKNCQPSCRCKPGFYRNKRNECISEDDCLKCKGPHEYFSCGGACDNVCATLNKQNQTNCPIRNVKCNERCYCEKDYARNDNGTCIPIKQCNKTCESIGKRYHCPVQRFPLKCRGSCRCEKGFYRNKIGDCVSKENCLKCTGPHEYFSCGGACDNVCATLDTENKTHCSIVNIKCNEMCYCEDGYARNDTGTCIPIKDCKKCPEGEIYNTCPPVKCDAEYCPQSRDDPLSCPIGIVCDKPRCTCGFNSHRDRRTNKCIATRDCPTFKCDGQNEEYNSCPPVCPGQTCNDYINNATCPKYRIGIVVPCTPKCRCTKGNWRNVEGVCVSGRECAKCPNPNEVWDECPAPCPPRRCDVDERVIRCAAPPKPGSPNCKPSCRCANGFYRNEKGICVTRDQCTPKCKRAHEVWNSCPSNCPPETCESIGKVYPCPLQKLCKGSCRCEKGFHRNKIGECISKKNCLKCTGPHEYFSCGGACDNVCDTLDKENKTHCSIINVKCNEMCYCEDGYARNDTGTCILIKNCKQKETNTTNETLPKTNTTSPPVNSTDAQQRFENGNVIFTGKCFKEIVETNNGSSVIMSPFSILFLLAQLALYTKEDSHKELMNILSLNSDDEIRDVFPKIIKMYQEQQSVQFDLAGKVYINDKYELSDAFKQDTKNVFDSEADNIDVSNPQKAAATINAWVEAKTNHLITDLVSPQMINDLTRLVLTNAIYFKGNWVKQFNPKYTTERNFTLANHDVKQIKMMYQKGSFRYAESKELDAKILELPYKGKNFTFVAILPNKVDGVNALVKKLVDPDVFKRAMSSLTTSTVMIHLPIVETSLQIDLTTILKKLGVTKCFIPGESGITGILKKLVDLYVSVFLQKAKIIINETGTEAAAANVAIVGTTAAIFPPPVVNTFDADHAFAYFLNLEDKPMFIGTYTGKP